MAKSNAKSDSGSVDTLLQDRQKLEEWIERLDLASDETPPEVRQRVREDYQARLTTVLAELNNFADELGEALKMEVETREELWAEERDARNRLAEAQLRHTVGEYTDKEWQEIQAEVDEILGRVSAGLENATAEIGRLEDVLGAMQPAPRGPVAADTQATEPAEGEAEKTQSDTEQGPPPAQGDQDASKPQVDAFDSKDVTLIKSNKSTAEPDHSESKAAAGKDDQTAESSGDPEPDHVEENVPRPSTIGVEVAMPKAEKTLKCSECGEMNFPTEWYCEHCGAELASL